MGIEIAPQRIIQHPHFKFLPRHVAEDRVYAHAHDLGIEAGELVAICMVRRRLGRSSRRPVKRVEGQHHVPVPPELAQLEPMFFFPGTRRNIEVRRGPSRLKSCHELSSLERICTAPQTIDFTSRRKRRASDSERIPF